MQTLFSEKTDVPQHYAGLQVAFEEKVVNRNHFKKKWKKVGL